MEAQHSDALFAQACLAPASGDHAPTLPPGLATRAGEAVARRFAVHRTTVMVTLIDALATAFPVVRALVGEEFFRAAARLYITADPPRSPVLARYGDGFGDFLSTFPPAAELPYLPDMARLERFMVDAYHAADAVPADRALLARLDPQQAAELALARHPAARMLRSPWPVLTLWRMNTGHMPLAPLAEWNGEDVLITRPELDVLLSPLPAGAEDLMAELAAPTTLAALAAATEAREPGLLARLLPALLDAGALCPAGAATPIAADPSPQTWVAPPP